MPANITGSAGITIARHYPPIVEIRRHWWDPWSWEPDLAFSGGHVCTAGEGASQIKIGRRYGQVKQPWEQGWPAARHAWNLNGWWVRISFVGPSGLSTVFVGRVDSEDRELHGVDNGPSGHQAWTCYGPERILAKTAVGRSFWLVPDAKADAATPGEVRELGWAPDFNREDEGQFGNRTTNRQGETAGEPGTCYLFGGTHQWSNFDIAEYVLAKFVDESTVYEDPQSQEGFGPTWRLAGQTDPLKSLYATIDMGKTTTVDAILRTLIPIERGLDFVVRPFEAENEDGDLELAGYEVYVYSISPREYSFGGQTLPANPNQVQFDLARSEGVQVSISRSAEHTYGRLRLIGERIVICGSIWGTGARTMALASEPADAGVSNGNEIPWVPTDVWSANTITKQWSAGLEADYQSANGRLNELASDHKTSADQIRQLDEVREHAKYEAVYQHFGAPDQWDMDLGGWTPAFDSAGELLLDQVDPEADPDTAELKQHSSSFQIQVRSTLDWIPMFAGYDYRPVADEDGQLSDIDWPVKTNTAIDRPELLGPRVWVYDNARGGFVDVSKEFEISVQAPRREWGFELNVTPNHFLAAGHWADESLTLTYPQLDWEDLVATIAIESDHRYTVDIELPGARPSDGVKEVPVEDCQLWVLAPCTMLRGKRWDDDSAGPSGSILVHSGPFTRILRRDTEKMELAAAGCLSRYLAERVRVRFEAKAMLAWGPLVGQLLGWVNQGGDVTDVQAPITRVEWSAAQNSVTTTVCAGFAR